MKIIARIFFLLLFIGMILGIRGYFYLKEMSPPSIKDAPYALQAYYETGGKKLPTRYYYAKDIEFEDGKAVLTNFWTYDGEKYHNYDDKRIVEPPFDIIRRKT